MNGKFGLSSLPGLKPAAIVFVELLLPLLCKWEKKWSGVVAMQAFHSVMRLQKDSKASVPLFLTWLLTACRLRQGCYRMHWKFSLPSKHCVGWREDFICQAEKITEETVILHSRSLWREVYHLKSLLRSNPEIQTWCNRTVMSSALRAGGYVADPFHQPVPYASIIKQR